MRREHVIVVEDPSDTAERSRRVQRLHSVAGGTLVVSPTPSARGDGKGYLARDLYRALGKDPDLKQRARSDAVDWAMLKAWIAAEEVATVVVLHAELVPAAGWGLFDELARDCGPQVWLLCPGAQLSSRHRDAAAAMGAARAGWAEFARRVRPPAPAAGGGAAAPFPAVPRDDFPTFRASCRRLLDEEAFAAVDDCYRAQLADALAWCDASPIGEAALSEYLRTRAVSGTVDEAVARVRAVQAALFARGFYLKVDMDKLTGHLGLAERAPLDGDTADRLRRLVDPADAAAAVLALAVDRDVPDYVAVRMADVSGDGRTVRVGGAEAGVPGTCAPIVRAQHRYRTAQGAGPADPFFANAKARAWGPRRFTAALRKVSQDTGLATGGGHRVLAETTRRNWAYRAGFLLVEVAP